MAWNNTWDETEPAAGDPANQAHVDIQHVMKAVRERMDAEHDASSGDDTDTWGHDENTARIGQGLVVSRPAASTAGRVWYKTDADSEALTLDDGGSWVDIFDQVLDAKGVLDDSGQLATSLGGTGLDTSSSSGYPKVSGGTWSIMDQPIVGVSSDDSDPDVLEHKLNAGDGITITTLNPGGDEAGNIAVTAGSADYSIEFDDTQASPPLMLRGDLDVGDPTAADNGKCYSITGQARGWTGIEDLIRRVTDYDVAKYQNLVNDNGSIKLVEQVQNRVSVSANDTTKDFLENKLTSVDGVGLTVNNEGATEEILVGFAAGDFDGHDDTKKRRFVNDHGTEKWEDIPSTTAHHNPNAAASTAGLSGGIGDGEAADGSSWSISTDTTKGLDLTMVTRVDYYDAGDSKLYGYERILSFDEYGHLVNVSAESRVTIDNPVTGTCS